MQLTHAGAIIFRLKSLKRIPCDKYKQLLLLLLFQIATFSVGMLIKHSTNSKMHLFAISKRAHKIGSFIIIINNINRQIF